MKVCGKDTTFYMENYNSNIILNSILYILNNYDNEIIYIHNINFDGILILNYISNAELDVELLIRDMNIYKIIIKKNNKKVDFRCSYKLLPESLKNIAKTFRIGEKSSFPYLFSSYENLKYIGETPEKIFFNSEEDYQFFKKKDFFDFKKESIKYCKNDVNITSIFVQKIKEIINEFDIDIKNCYSAPSLSLKIFIKKFNNNRLSFNIKENIDKIIRKSYHGGRCEVYGNPTNGEYIHYYDFSGMYGQCMLEKFPYGDIKIIKNSTDVNDIGFHFIEYESNMEYPILPHKSKINEKLLFTNGFNVGLFWYEEIMLFEKHGGVIKKIFFSVIAEKYDNVFSDFVNYFENIKKKNEIYKKFGKLVINSLYGRLGMKNISNEFVLIKKENFGEYDKSNRIKSFKEINNLLLLELESINKIKTKNNIILASCITSKARIKLYKAQMDVINNGGRLLYSDTDSIFASYKKNVRDEIHGVVDWSKEKKVIEDAVFISSKTYGIKTNEGVEIKIKGFDISHTLYDDIKEKFYGGIDIENKEKTITKNTMILKLDEKNKKVSLNNYDKRKFFDNKKKTKPLKIINEFTYV